METHAPYSSVPGIDGHGPFRPETMLPANAGWLAPTPVEFQHMLALTGFTQYQAGLFLGLSVQPATAKSGNTCRTVRRWLNGDSVIPYAAWAMLCSFAGFGEIWRS